MHPSKLILLLLLALAVLVAAAPTYKPITVSTEIEAYALLKAPKLATAKDKAIFWSLDPPAGYADMNEYLKKTYIPTSGGKVLLIDKIIADGGPPAAYVSDRGYWAAISKSFAAGASGEVVYLVGNPRAGYKYQDSIFYQTELPELTKPRSAVTSIVAIDAITPANRRVIWQTGDGHWGMGAADEAATPADIFESPAPASCGDGKVKRAGVASCPLPGAKSRATTGKAGTAKGKAAAGTGQSAKKEAASKGAKAPAASTKVEKGKTQPKAAASKGPKATAASTKAENGKKQPKAAASKKLRQKRAGPSRISGDV
ncbi:hypothetical protein DFP73DRAFT_599698 [Morchella snyderi]|nr:hypothetical protein DFP73DRAFT_599698 [Morchella snyderi]